MSKEWERLETISVKYEISTLDEFNKMIHDCVKKHTVEDIKDEDIHLEFLCHESLDDWYDKKILESNLIISIRKDREIIL